MTAMGGYSKVNVRRLAREQGGRCFYCPAPLNPRTPSYQNPDGMTRDHVVPRCKAKSLPNNIVAACWWCNHYKGDADADAFRKALPGLWFKHGRKFAWLTA